jgi:hypothetical protein
MDAGSHVRHSVRPRSKVACPRATYAGKWKLPRPTANLDLYRRTKKLLDEIEAERNEARRERDAVKTRCAELESELEGAKTVLREWAQAQVEVQPPRQKKIVVKL